MLSPTLQRTAISDYAAARGYTVTDWLEGVDESGSSARSAWWARLDQACNRVEAGDVDVVLVWKFSRIARHRLKWAVAVDRVETAGGRIESATEQVDTTTSTGRFTRGMLAELQSFEAERIGEQWRETHAHRRARGLPHNGGPRLGYVYEKGAGYTPDPDTAPVLRDLYGRYIAGSGWRSLQLHLDHLGIVQPRTGRSWTVRGVALTLGNGFAAGYLSVHDPACGCRKPAACVRRVHTPGAQEPIITEETWADFVRVRDTRAATPSRRLGSPHVLSGLVRCAGCDHAMRVRPATSYRSQRLECPEARQCPAPAGVVYRLVYEAVEDWKATHSSEAQAALTAALARHPDPQQKPDRLALERAVARADEALARLTVNLARGLVPDSAYTAARDELLAEQRRARAGLDEAPVARRDAPHQPMAGQWEDLHVGEHRDALQALLDVVVTRHAPDPASVEVTRRDAQP